MYDLWFKDVVNYDIIVDHETQNHTLSEEYIIGYEPYDVRTMV